MQTKNRLWCKSTGRIEINAKLFLNRQHIEGDKTAGPAGRSGADIPCGDELMMSRLAWLQRQVWVAVEGWPDGGSAPGNKQRGKNKTHNPPWPSKPLWFLVEWTLPLTDSSWCRTQASRLLGSCGGQLINRLTYSSYMMLCCRAKHGKHKNHHGACVQSLEICTFWLKSFSLELLGLFRIFFLIIPSISAPPKLRV